MRLRTRWFEVGQGSLVLLCALAIGVVVACGDEDSGGGASSTSGERVAEARRSSGRADSVAQGQQLYQRECQSCHGPDGDRLPAAPLSSIDFLNSRGDATLLAVVADGKGTMPAFGKRRGGPFEEDEVRAAVAYVNSKAGRGSTTLLAAAGEALYSQHCETCHGPTGDRIPVAPLDAQGFLDSRTDSQLRDVILNGTGTMRGFGGGNRPQLSDEQATALTSFLRYRVQAQTVKSVGNGRDLYVGNCLSCHGTGGDRVKDVALGSAPFLTGLGDGKVINAITRGTKTGPAFGVEAGGAFNVPDTAALISYLKSWSGLSATSALSAAALTGLGGEAIFVQNCAACHGPTGDQVAGVQLRSPTYLTQQGKDVVRRTIEVGNKKGMPAWSQKSGGPLSDQQIGAVVDFLYGSSGASASAGGAAATAAASAAGGAAAGPSPFPNGQSPSDFFGARCAGCHGADRKGLVGPSLLAEALTKPSDFYIETIMNGRPGTAMPAWGQQGVTKEMATALVEFFKGGSASGAAPAAAGGAAPAAAGGGAASGDATVFDGKPPSEFFTSKCAACHGADRKGVVGPALLPDRLTQPDQFYVDTILKGRPGTAMPAWEAQGVNATQAAAMVRFLKTPPASSSAAPAAGGGGTLLTSTAGGAPRTQARLFGQELFETTCALCHGKDGMAQAPCPLGSKVWLSNMSAEGLITRISRGKPPRMPTWAEKYGGSLTDEQIQSVAQYLMVMAK